MTKIEPIDNIEADVLIRICQRFDVPISDLNVQPIPTSGNLVYKIDINDAYFALHRSGRQRYISIDAQVTNMGIAHAYGLSPKCIWNDGANYILTQWVPSNPDIEPQKSIDLLIPTLHIMAQLHSTNLPFTNTISVQEALDWNLRQMNKISQSNQTLVNKALRFLNGLTNVDEVNCHGDFIQQNILSSRSCEQLLIDWEFSHRNTAYWDIATWANDGKLSQTEGHEMLRKYTHLRQLYQPDNSFFEDTARLDGYRGVMALISMVWVLNESNNSNDPLDPLYKQYLTLANQLL